MAHYIVKETHLTDMNTITPSIDIYDHDLEGLANKTVYIELL